MQNDQMTQETIFIENCKPFAYMHAFPQSRVEIHTSSKPNSTVPIVSWLNNKKW